MAEDDDLAAILQAAKSSGGSSRKRGIDYAATFEANQAFRFEQLFVSLWGEKPNPSYITSRVKSGWSTVEFEQHERAKPAFRASQRYAEEQLAAELELARRFNPGL